MKKFVELIQRIHQERFSVVVNKIVAEKIPVAFLSIAPVENAVETVKNLRAQNLNITNLITITPPPPDYFQIDFDITNLGDVGKIHPRPEYIFTNNSLDSRVANKYIKDCKIICPIINDNYHYDFFMNHLTEFQEVYESFIDEESRKTFYGYWFVRMSCQLGEFHYSNNMQYISEGFIPERGAIVIDCGTCDGGTASRFAGMGYKVYGFEMDSENYKLAKKLANEKGFVVENLGLGSYRHAMKYNHQEGNIGMSKLDPNGTETAQVITLDSYVADKNLPRVDFIKMDVEGAELDILKGATTTISRYKPILALSAYHKLDDFWTLMNYIKSIRPDYEWALRHYASNSEDVPFVFRDGYEDELYNLGLDPVEKGHVECCLLAR